jgi:hypothetical protein
MGLRNFMQLLQVALSTADLVLKGLIGLLQFAELVKLVAEIVSQHRHQLRVGHIIEGLHKGVSYLRVEEPCILTHIQIIANIKHNIDE